VILITDNFEELAEGGAGQSILESLLEMILIILLMKIEK
jgi:hypothetical protein